CGRGLANRRSGAESGHTGLRIQAEDLGTCRGRSKSLTPGRVAQPRRDRITGVTGIPFEIVKGLYARFTSEEMHSDPRRRLWRSLPGPPSGTALQASLGCRDRSGEPGQLPTYDAVAV